MKKLLLLIFLISSLVTGQNEQLFEQANTQYGEGNYEEAIELYEQILENGEASVAVYYNLGNAHYKLNNVAPSIYYFEKALQLDPKDPDVNNNIALARQRTLDEISENEETGFSKIIKDVVSTFSVNTWAKIAIGFSVLFAAFFLAYYFNTRPRAKRLFFAGAVVVFLLGAGSIFFAMKQREIQLNNQFAIIYVEEAGVRDEPSMREETAFSLHEGTKARVLENYQGWVKIELADGTQGWVEDKSLKKL